MRWQRTYSSNAHCKNLPWAYEETLEKINTVEDKFWRDFFITSYATAGRQGEIIKLKANDISINNDTMTIHLLTEKMREKAFAFRDLPINPNYSIVELSCFETIKDLKNHYIDFIGIEFTDFVNDNYEHILINYNKLPAKKKKQINFPVFCYCIYRNVFIDDVNYKINEN